MNVVINLKLSAEPNKQLNLENGKQQTKYLTQEAYTDMTAFKPA